MRKVFIFIMLASTAWAGVTRTTAKAGRSAGVRTAHVTASAAKTSAKVARKAASTAWKVAY